MLSGVEKIKAPYFCGASPISVNKTGEWRLLTPTRRESLSPCSSDCLLEGEIPLWLEAVKRESWPEAWQIMSRNNPFPALTGHVCYQSCTANCNRGRLDEEVDIREVEKAIGYWRLDNYEPGGKAVTSKGKVAVAGSGPAGLSCAYYLAVNGYAVTVFEKSAVIGGMAALGIPEYRLPRTVLQRELAILEDMGIDFVTACEVGKDVEVARLYSEYDHLFLATGAWLSRRAGIKGEEAVGVWYALDFLSLVNRGGDPESGGTVVVIGGGNAAIDSARTALRQPGVDHVSLVYRRSRAEMPAEPSEVEAAEDEGVELIFNALPREIITKNGAAVGIGFDYCRTGLEGLIVDRNRSFEKSCSTVIMALGQDPDYSIFGQLKEARPLYAGGDLVSGPATVPEAIRAGRLAAFSLLADLEGTPLPDFGARPLKKVSFEDLNLAAKVNLQLQQKQTLPFEEAARCLGCGSCNSCGVCYLFCPDLAVDRSNGSYEFNLDYCKGCGICAEECPARALVMEGGV